MGSRRMAFGILSLGLFGFGVLILAVGLQGFTCVQLASINVGASPAASLNPVAEFLLSSGM